MEEVLHTGGDQAAAQLGGRLALGDAWFDPGGDLLGAVVGELLGLPEAGEVALGVREGGGARHGGGSFWSLSGR